MAKTKSNGAAPSATAMAETPAQAGPGKAGPETPASGGTATAMDGGADGVRQRMTAVLGTFRRRDTQDWSNAWVGIEPTFQTRKSIKKWQKMAAKGPAGEDAYFLDDYMLGTQRKVARAIKKRYEKKLARGCERDGAPPAHCLFSRVTLEEDLDQWKVKRQNISFHWDADGLAPFQVRFSLDPETFEYSIKPVPLVWFYEDAFVDFLDDFLYKVPLKAGLSVSMAHGGAQFSLSAKTYLRGSLLADDIATKLNHPELATFMMDWPNPDDRAFRATRRRFQAFRTAVEQYWKGAFHPKATGPLTAENAFLDRGFEPAAAPPAGLVDPKTGPVGDARDVFQTNFCFGRAVRLRAQAIHPGYWQSAHPSEDGYRPDQIMRYSEANLNRLQIAGELHVKSGKPLEPERAPELFGTPLDLDMLTTEASWENRAQMSKTSARDFVEALLLDVHAARWLQANPHVAVKDSLLQDQLHGDAEKTLEKHDPATLDRLRREARQANLEASRGRLKTDWVEPEALFWAAWLALPAREKAAIAREAVNGFVERVENAASVDPRRAATGTEGGAGGGSAAGDPMEWHRHRVHPQLWDALEAAPDVLKPGGPARRELNAWRLRRDTYVARRPVFSQLGTPAPWEVDRVEDAGLHGRNG